MNYNNAILCWRDDAAVDCQTGTSGAVAEIDLPASPAIDVSNMTHTHKRQTAMFVSATFRAILEHFFLMVISRVPSSFCVFYEVHNCVTIYNRSPIDIVSQYAPG